MISLVAVIGPLLGLLLPILEIEAPLGIIEVHWRVVTGALKSLLVEREATIWLELYFHHWPLLLFFYVLGVGPGHFGDFVPLWV